ncbi:putative RRM domain-containing protein [Seiridium unicorne]|uniref:RRM domain-containing protein n=1 Tax=Seiridium unicorne TaxID=138068 RepID=A0ABR2UTG7_9PEZI
MAYPPAPGATNSSSLPPRPPPSKVSGFKPAFSAAPTHTPSPVSGNPYTPPTHSTAPSYSSAPSYAGAPAPQYGGGRGASYQSYPQQGSMNYNQDYQQAGYQQGYYGTAAPADNSTYAATPQIRNPFPAPGQAPQNGDYDPDMAAQIAQWQSAYVKDPKDTGAPPRPGASTTTYSATPTPAVAPVVPVEGEKKKTVVRQGGGQKWTDDSLLEWDPAHLRLFVGNLAGETTDESLHKAFARWKSLQKARVIRDKITSKSKGFGFVSFSDPDDFFQAAKEMNGKYIQSHPVVVRKSTTEIKYVTLKANGKIKQFTNAGENRPHTVKDKRHGGKWNNKNKNKNRSGNGNGGREDSFEPSLGPASGGVVKPGQKTKNGLKLLG